MFVHEVMAAMTTDPCRTCASSGLTSSVHSFPKRPFGLPPSLPVLVDARVMEPDWIVLGGGNRSSKLHVAPETLRRLASVKVIEGLAFLRD